MDMQNPFIIGEKVYLRPRDLGDVDPFVMWLNDEEIRRCLLMTYPINSITEREYIETRLSDDKQNIRLGIALKEDDRLIGGIGLSRISMPHRHATVGIFIGDKSCWSKGYGTEAIKLMLSYGFGKLNLHRISLSVFDFSKRAMRAYEKAGFIKEGLVRDGTYKNGRYWDVHLMAILENEWREQN
jgi:RimJ/RimL family protein N-acetyltransferase